MNKENLPKIINIYFFNKDNYKIIYEYEILRKVKQNDYNYKNIFLNEILIFLKYNKKKYDNQYIDEFNSLLINYKIFFIKNIIENTLIFFVTTNNVIYDNFYDYFTNCYNEMCKNKIKIKSNSKAKLDKIFINNNFILFDKVNKNINLNKNINHEYLIKNDYLAKFLSEIKISRNFKDNSVTAYDSKSNFYNNLILFIKLLGIFIIFILMIDGIFFLKLQLKNINFSII